LKRRLVATIEWLREFPNAGPFPQLWHTFAIEIVDGSRIEISPHLNGPATSGQGGYCCGLFAAMVGNPAEATLRRPVPLGKPLAATKDDEAIVRVHDGEALVAEARSAAPRVVLPEAVSLDQAERARERFPGHGDEAFSRCFVCGTARPDSQRVWPGPVEGGELVATPWTPRDEWLGDGTHVRPEFVWAVLDCPASWAPMVVRADLLVVLGRLTVDLREPVPMGEPYAIAAWPVGSDGRKQIAGAALLNAAGHALAVAEALLIEIEKLPDAAGD
jgi:hypothetical protein